MKNRAQHSRFTTAHALFFVGGSRGRRACKTGKESTFPSTCTDVNVTYHVLGVYTALNVVGLRIKLGGFLPSVINTRY